MAWAEGLRPFGPVKIPGFNLQLSESRRGGQNRPYHDHATRPRQNSTIKISPRCVAKRIPGWKSPGDARFTQKHPHNDRSSHGGQKFILTTTPRRAAEEFSGYKSPRDAHLVKFH